MQILDSSYPLVETLMQEYAYITIERNRATQDENGEIEGKDYDWVELPSFDDPSQMVRTKRYYDISDKYGKE